MSKRTKVEPVNKPDFGQIPFELICRFGELTKFEIRVLCVLYGARNSETKKCNPSRRTIADWGKIDRSNLFRALVGLEKKSWIMEMENKEFVLNENPPEPDEIVVDSTTKKESKMLSKQQHDVVESTTRNNKDLKNIKRTYKTNSKSEPSSDVFAEFDFKVDTAAHEIFTLWQETFKKQKSRYDEQRQKLIIRARDKFKFSVEELKTAICGVNNSPFHKGENDTKTKYLDFSTIFKSRAQVERFIELVEEPETVEQKESEPENDQLNAYQAMLRNSSSTKN